MIDQDVVHPNEMSMDQFYTEVELADGTKVFVPFIRQSERSSFKSCQHQWNWSWNMGLTPALPKSDARWFGTGLHLALAEWYPKGKKRGKNPHDTWDKYIGEEYTTISTGPYFKPDEFVTAKELGHEMIGNYLEEYGLDKEIEIIATEQRYRMKIYAPDKDSPTGKRLITILVGTFDAVFRNLTNGYIWMIDHKTARDRITTNHLVKDEQAGTYVSVGTKVLQAQGLIGPDEKVHGIMYNFLRKAKADLRPRNTAGAYLNKDGSVSKQQPAPLFKREYIIRNDYERARQVERIREEAQQMAAIRGGQLPLLKSPGDHCAWCDFRDLCDVDEQGGDVNNYISAAFKVRDPYADHREGAQNSKSGVSADKTAKKKARAF